MAVAISQSPPIIQKQLRDTAVAVNPNDERYKI